MQLECFTVMENAPQIVPGKAEREWMDAFHLRFPYRCLPLTMANTTGWEILCPAGICISWSGGNDKKNVTVSCRDPLVEHCVQSHFSHGIVTFHTGYLFRTPPQYALWVGGAPNHVKDGIQPLTGLVETDWLPFPFTMNWKMTRPGIVRFKKDEPFCFIQLIEHHKMDEVRPVIRKIEDEPALQKEYETWTHSRAQFNANIEDGHQPTMKQAWQKFYFKGEKPEGNDQAEGHINRRRLRAPSILEAP